MNVTKHVATDNINCNGERDEDNDKHAENDGFENNRYCYDVYDDVGDDKM